MDITVVLVQEAVQAAAQVANQVAVQAAVHAAAAQAAAQVANQVAVQAAVLDHQHALTAAKAVTRTEYLCVLIVLTIVLKLSTSKKDWIVVTILDHAELSRHHRLATTFTHPTLYLVYVRVIW